MRAIERKNQINARFLLLLLLSLLLFCTLGSLEIDFGRRHTTCIYMYVHVRTASSGASKDFWLVGPVTADSTPESYVRLTRVYTHGRTTASGGWNVYLFYFSSHRDDDNRFRLRPLSPNPRTAAAPRTGCPKTTEIPRRSLTNRIRSELTISFFRRFFRPKCFLDLII